MSFQAVPFYPGQPVPPVGMSQQVPLRTRMLQLSPGYFQDEIECTLEVVDLRNIPYTYEALSYRWSKGTDAVINCNGQRKGISSCLAETLRHLRRHNEPRRLWIDFLCINQDDLGERSEQVKIMRWIYKTAARVIVWIGPADNSSGEALQLVRLLIAYRDQHVRGKGINAYTEFAIFLTQTMKGDHIGQGALQQALLTRARDLQNLLTREWFERVWCIQEAFVSSQCLLMCGNDTVDFFDFISTAPVVSKALVLYAEAYKDPISTEDFWLEVYSQSQGEFANSRIEGAFGDLLPILDSSRDFKSSDPRDHIYAILGISNEGLQAEAGSRAPLNPTTWPPNVRVLQSPANRAPLIWMPPALARAPHWLPDYNKSIVDVYREFTILMMHRWRGKLDVLSHVQHRDNPGEGFFPSWVPKWFQPAQVQGKFISSELSDIFHAHGVWTSPQYDKPLYGISSMPDSLFLTGFRVDRVRTVSDALSANPDEILAIDVIWMQMFGGSILHSPGVYRNGQRLDNAFCFTLLAGMFGAYWIFMMSWSGSIPLGVEQDFNGLANALYPTVRRLDVDIAAWKLENLDLSSMPPHSLQALRAEAAGGDSALFGTTANRISYGRRIFVTDSGFLGLGPKAMLPGDIVCVLLGGSVPFVLRPMNGYYLLIGETYIHDDGVMWGGLSAAVVGGTAVPPVPVEVFELR